MTNFENFLLRNQLTMVNFNQTLSGEENLSFFTLKGNTFFQIEIITKLRNSFKKFKNPFLLDFWASLNFKYTLRNDNRRCFNYSDVLWQKTNTSTHTICIHYFRLLNCKFIFFKTAKFKWLNPFNTECRTTLIMMLSSLYLKAAWGLNFTWKIASHIEVS